MKAIVFEEYGPPDVLQLVEMEKPTPKDDEVLVKVHATSVNWQDWHLMRADPFLVRLMVGLQKPKYKILGTDVAGTVEAVGANIMQFQSGDEVFGFGGGSDLGIGAFAEYVCVSENVLVSKPANVSFEDAAATPTVALTALQGLRDHGMLKPGSKVLINGASGGVGTFAVQIAKSLEAEVTAVCSTRNLEMVRSLGADQVIDYTQGDFTQKDLRFDLIIDNVGNPEIYKRLYRNLLNPGGICVIIAGSFYLRFLLGPWMTMTGGNKIGTYQTVLDKNDLVFVKDLLEAGTLAPVIDRRYPLSDVPEAMRYLEAGHARGKVIISVV